MKFADISRQNLRRDSRVLGKSWNRVYGNYFSNLKVIHLFIASSAPLLRRLPLNTSVLYLCGGTGLLGEAFCAYLKHIGKNPSLTLVDASPEQLRQNRNQRTRKIKQDVLFLDLGEKFDVVLMRSSLDYFPRKGLQVQVLKRVARHLKPGGIFLNQSAAFPSIAERNLADTIYASNAKIGKRHFQCPPEISGLYRKAGLRVKLIGHAPILKLNEEDHRKRYGLTNSEVEKIRQIIKNQPRTKAIKITKKGYEINCSFPIYAARKFV